MDSLLTKKESIAVCIMQAIILKRETIRPTPRQAAKTALEHTEALLQLLENPKKEKDHHLRLLTTQNPHQK